MLCCMSGTIRGLHGLEFRYGASMEGVWAYRPEHLDTTHALKSRRGAARGARARAREPEAGRSAGRDPRARAAGSP